MPSSGTINIYQGDDYEAVVTVALADNTPADLTGYEALAHIRRNVADSDPVIVYEIPVAISGSDLFIRIPHEVTETLKGRYVWDLQLTSPDGFVDTVIAGSVQVTLEVTRPQEAEPGRLVIVA